MFFPQSSNPEDRRAQEVEILRRQQCHVCPLRQYKRDDPPDEQLDVLVLSERTTDMIGSGTTGGLRTRHVFNIECSDLLLRDRAQYDAVRECCMGRKCSMITKFRPKVLLSVGTGTFSKMENVFGLDTDTYGFLDGIPFPTEYEGHRFWHITVPEFDTKMKIMEIQSLLRQCTEVAPEVERGNLDGIKLVMNREQLRYARSVLLEAPLIAGDVETRNLRPYADDSTILSIALSVGQETFAFPLDHPQTPSSIDPEEVFELLREIARSEAKVVFHNAPFDCEWLTHKLGRRWLYDLDLHDTMSQAYVLSSGPKSLNFLTRKFRGFNLKKMSKIDSARLWEAPLEKVLWYNGLDAKYTYYLWLTQQPLVQEEGLEHIYEMQIERTRAVILMQIGGMIPDIEFIRDQSDRKSEEIRQLRKQFSELDIVQRFQQETQSPCNPTSDKDVARLHHQYLGVPKDVTSFDEAFLSTVKHDAARLILQIRGASKIYSTYLVPYDKQAAHQNAGQFICDDGLIHAIFNTMRTATGRLSSEKPNSQNQPSGSQKWLRNVVRAAETCMIFSADFGQIEYRFIAVLSGDPVMIKSINEGLDIHAFWARRFIEMFPGTFVKDPDDPKEFKLFRNVCKNQVVFPFCFGASAHSIGQSMGVSDKKMKAISDMFWGEHKRVKQWQEELRWKHDREGFVQNAFGRKYRKPLAYNAIINYPIQGSNGDMVNNKMARLARMSVEQERPWLCPVVNEHDNLWFYFPIEHFDEGAEAVLKVMLDRADVPGFCVPLVVEAEIGPAWGSLKPLGTYESGDFGL